jgi:hypothetical protein
MTIFFVAYEQANVVCIAPVLRALAGQGAWDPIFVPGTDFKAHRGLAEAIAPAGVRVWQLRVPPGAVATGHAADAHRTVLDRVRELGAGLTESNDFECRVVGAAMQRVFAQPYMPEVCATYAAVAQGLAAFARSERPALVVLAEDTDYMRGRLAARVLLACGATVVCLVPWYYGAFRSYPLIGTRWAARYLVPTRSYGERLVAGGVARDRIAIVGDPALDALPAAAGHPSRPGGLLYALQGLPWEREIITDLVEIVRSERRATLHIKPHPRLPVPAWLQDVETAGNVVVADRDADVRALLIEATAVVGQSSKMLYEASILGCAVIVPHYDATPLVLDLPDTDREHVVARTRKALRRKVELVLTGRGRGLTRAEIAPHHPHATARVVECLQSVREWLERGCPPEPRGGAGRG